MKVLMTILLTLGSSSSFTADLAQVDEQFLDLNEIKELRYSSECIRILQPAPLDVSGSYAITATIDVVNQNDQIKFTYNVGNLWFYKGADSGETFQACEDTRKKHYSRFLYGNAKDESELLAEAQKTHGQLFKSADRKSCYTKLFVLSKRDSRYLYHPVTGEQPKGVVIRNEMVDCPSVVESEEFQIDIKDIKSSHYHSECIKATQPFPSAETREGPFVLVASIDLTKNDDSVIRYTTSNAWFYTYSGNFQACEEERTQHNGYARNTGGLDEQELLKKIKSTQDKIFKTADQKTCYRKNVAFIKRGNLGSFYSYHPVTGATPITAVETKEKVDCEATGIVTQIPGEMIIKAGTYHASNGCSLNIAHNALAKEIIINVFKDQKCNISGKDFYMEQKSPESPNEYLNRDKDTLSIISENSFVFLGAVFVEKLFEPSTPVVVNTPSSRPQVQRTTYKKCYIGSYDACPSAAQWSCKRYAVYGMAHDFWVTTIKKGLFENKAYEMLSNLRGAGLCP